MASIQPSTFSPLTVNVLAFASIFSIFPLKTCSFFAPAGAFFFSWSQPQDRSRPNVTALSNTDRTYFIFSSKAINLRELWYDLDNGCKHPPSARPEYSPLH